MSLNHLYQQTILAHNKSPKNFKELGDATHKCRGKNPLCGDDFELFLTIKNDMIVDVGFQGHGCAISKASASMMSEMIKTKSLIEISIIKDVFLDMILNDDKTASDRDELGKLNLFKGVKEYPVRVKCATLIWRALESAMLQKNNKEITTE